MSKKKQNWQSLNWCYIGEDNDRVLMVCSREDWKSIIEIIEWAKNRLLKDRDVSPRISESDIANFSYTSRR